MEAQPDTLPRWATAGAIVEPDESKKDDGWELLEKPPHQYSNWYYNLVYQWIAWFRDRVNFGLDFSSPYFELAYDADDKITSVTFYESVSKITNLATLTPSYDSDDKITTAVLVISGSLTFTATISYDADDLVTSVEVVES